MTLKSPSALHIRPDDVLLVSDLDLQSVIALRLSMDCVSITATVAGRVLSTGGGGGSFPPKSFPKKII